MAPRPLGNWFPISRDPPEGGTVVRLSKDERQPPGIQFPISRDPPEGGTRRQQPVGYFDVFPISRDPPEGGTAAAQ